MFTCKRCNGAANDGVVCSVCQCKYDFPCAGISEGGWRKLGDRKLTWKCMFCKSGISASPQPTPASSPSPANMETILAELKVLSDRTASIPIILEQMKILQQELAEMKLIKEDIAELKSSCQFAHQSIDDLALKVTNLNLEVESLKETNAKFSSLQEKYRKLNDYHCETEQRLRMSNIEIKGVPITNNENLFSIVAKIGQLINCDIPKDAINYIARVPSRHDPHSKSIICSIHNRYRKEDFIAAAKKRNITPADLGLHGDSMVYVNDHLTLANKMLLNRTKLLAKERGFSFVWVKNCKILIRKNQTSPILYIKTEEDLLKYLP